MFVIQTVFSRSAVVTTTSVTSLGKNAFKNNSILHIRAANRACSQPHQRSSNFAQLSKSTIRSRCTNSYSMKKTNNSPIITTSQSRSSATIPKRMSSTIAKRSPQTQKKTFKTTTKTSSKPKTEYSPHLQKLQSKLLQIRTLPIPRYITPQKYSFNLSQLFGHLSFVLVAVSYATEDFLTLRVIAVAGSSCMMVFNYFHPHGRILWLPFQWNALFILINGYRIGTILYHRYMAMRMSEDLKKIKAEHFDVMDWSDFEKLVSIAKEETYEDEKLILYQGQRNPFIRLVIEGELKVCRDGIQTYNLVEGNFISEAGLHAGLLLSGDIESCCSITAMCDPSRGLKQTRVLRWDRSELMKLLNKESGLRRSLLNALSWDIIRKLKGQRQFIENHLVEDPELWTQKRREQTADRYASVLQNMTRHPDYLKTRRGELDNYRIIHQIDDEHHKLALKKCGWTVEEYEEGQKIVTHNGDTDEDDDDHESVLNNWRLLPSHLVRIFR